MGFAFAASLRAERGIVSKGAVVGPGVCLVELAKVSGLVEKNDFSVHRSLFDYFTYLGEDFRRALREVGENDQWLDAGSGSGYAILDYQRGYLMTELPSGKTIGVTVVLPKTGIAVRQTLIEEGYGSRNQFIFGNYIEDLPVEQLGKNKVISDLFGPMSYTSNPTDVMNRYLDVATPEAQIFLKTSYGKTSVNLTDGSTIAFEDYLGRVLAGHEVINHRNGQVHIRLKPLGVAKIPKLKLVRIVDDGTPPPSRVFEEVRP